ncbi:MAG: cell division protein FtsZ [Paludibacteraceae bacterium]|nr:cell division protein FtsZ [Paludibacteraceae bacterium]
MSLPEELPISLEVEDDVIIKVMGVGGGGCNAVNYMYETGIVGVSFLVCNTDKQSLGSVHVPKKLQLGPGLGAGGRPEVSQQYAEESEDAIRAALNDGTKMLFITAGMGGGTGTGAAPVVARIARDMGILTVGIVTIPFRLEGKQKIRKAMEGVKNMAQNVDALLVINNERLTEMHGDLDLTDALSRADDVLANAARSIAEIITVPGYINTDFADVYNTLKDGHIAIMNIGIGSGENRIKDALADACDSPLSNHADIHGASRILIQLYCKNVKSSELQQVTDFTDSIGKELDVVWGVTFDQSMSPDEVRVTLIATGYDIDETAKVIPRETKDIEGKIQDNYEGKKKKEQEDFRPNEGDDTNGSKVSIVDLDDVDDDPENTPAWLRNKKK